MHHPSLATSIAELRRAYTGEANNTLMPTVQRILAGLGHSQLTQLSSVVNGKAGGFNGRLLGRSSPTVDHKIRSTVLPDASTEAQRELETALLVAIGRIHAYWPLDNDRPHRDVFSWVRPDESELVVSLAPQALAAVLAELTPREHDGRLHGLAGLRIRESRKQVELYLADTQPEAVVFVSNISHRQLAAALTLSRTLTGCPTCPDEHPHRLSEMEALFAASGRVPGPARLASAVLRRLGMLGQADRIAIETVGSCLRLDWTGGPTPASVATLLTHPVTGLPDDTFTTTMPPDGTIILTCAGLHGSIALRRSVPAVPRRSNGPSIADAWQTFDETMSAPPHSAVVAPLETTRGAAAGAVDG